MQGEIVSATAQIDVVGIRVPFHVVTQDIAVEGGAGLQIADKQRHVTDSCMWLQWLHVSDLLDSEAVGNVHAGTFEHDGCAAVLFCRKRYRSFDFAFIQAVSRDHKLDVDVGKHLGCVLGTFGRQMGDAATHVLA